MRAPATPEQVIADVLVCVALFIAAIVIAGVIFKRDTRRKCGG